jgi:cytochrome c553
MTSDTTGAIDDADEQRAWRRKIRWVAVACVAFSSASIGCGTDGTDGTDSSAAALTLGGRLYDAWWEAKGTAEPEITFDYYVRDTAGTQTGSTTWRCSECHGWDYRGVEGQYGTGSHFTGVRGLLDVVATRSDGQLFAAIKLGTPTGSDSQLNEDHAFAGLMSDSDILALVLFLREGMIDLSPVIDATGGQIAGDADRGAALYAAGGLGTCGKCHDVDGRGINFGDDVAPEYVGTVVAESPWEALHKIRWGQPGTGMPSAVHEGLELQDQADILRHCQTLPIE